MRPAAHCLHVRPAGRAAAGLLLLTFGACGEEAPAPPPQLGSYERPPALQAAPARKAEAASARKPAAKHRTTADKALAARVREALKEKQVTIAEEIDVDARDGVITLSGTSENSVARELVEDVASRVEGVEMVENKIVLAGDAR